MPFKRASCFAANVVWRCGLLLLTIRSYRAGTLPCGASAVVEPLLPVACVAESLAEAFESVLDSAFFSA